MNPDVDERTAALLILFDEDAPSGDTAAAERLSARVVDLAHVTRVDEPLQRLGLAGEARHEAHLELLPALLGRRHHLLALAGIHGEWLLDQDMLAGIQGVNRRLLVQEVRRADAHRVDLVHRQQLLIVGELTRNVKLLRRRLCRGRDGIRDSDDPHSLAFQRLVARHVGGLCDPAAADNPNSNRFQPRSPSGGVL